MQDSLSVERFAELRGAPVYDSSGDKIGTVEELFWDEETRKPEWIGIGTGMFGTKRVLVPVAGANADGDAVTVPYSKDQVKDSPDIDVDEISESTEQELYAHYGLDYSEARSGSGLPAGGLDTGMEADQVDSLGDDAEGPASVTRSEEELAVGKRSVEAGQVRVRKWVETEPVTADVELTRERAHVVREQIDQPIDDAEIGEEEIGVTLREEEAVVGKQVVAKERIGLETDVETRTETATDELRKERVDIEGDVDR
jgi:uncharacterized protein (TIGR02271 family)